MAVLSFCHPVEFQPTSSALLACEIAGFCVTCPCRQVSRCRHGFDRFLAEFIELPALRPCAVEASVAALLHPGDGLGFPHPYPPGIIRQALEEDIAV